MSFRSLDLPFQVNTTRDNPVDVLFDPLLRLANRYDVAVGYFSTAWIRDAASGIAALATNGGTSRWVISPALTADDWRLLSQATTTEDRQHIVEQAAAYSYEHLQRALETETRTAIGWLVRDRILTFQIAIPTNELSGIFHAKIGIFYDADDNQVAFTGSYNLTGAAATNWETMDVYVSWKPGEAQRVAAKINDFNRIWEKADPNLELFSPTDALVARFISITESTNRPYRLKTASPAAPASRLQIPAHFLNKSGLLREHQEMGISSWFKNNGRGIFQMATGSGKTVAALAVATKLTDIILQKKRKLVIVVTVPYKHLAQQWEREAKAFGFDPLICFESFENWAPTFHRRIANLKFGISDFALFITVNATFSGDRMQGMLSAIDTTFLLIADEMHNMGSEKLRHALPDHANFRLGLSATPDRHNDDVGTRAIRQYFGETVIEYGLADAIRDGTLTRYFYYPILVEFTAEEMGRYHELCVKIGRLFAQSGTDTDEPAGALKMALLERARMVGSAENKIITLKSLLSQRTDSSYNLVYCGDVITDDERSVDKVVAMIGTELGMRVKPFTSLESNDTRREILDTFSNGELQVVAAIRCLDEGIDIPRTETAYILASSSNPRQYIQRRGRVLRRAEGKHFSAIYDFVVVPPREHPSEAAYFNVERRLMKKELERVDEFASTSENAGDALAALRTIKIRLNLLDS